MILEQAVIDVTAGQEEAFERAYEKARQFVAGSPGCISMRLHRGLEQPSRFLLLVEWDTLDSHLVGFRESERFTQWRASIGPYLATPPDVHHFSPPDE